MARSHGPGAYINRELSWLRFNERVLELAEDRSLPLLERMKFVAIYARNLDEYFMVRVAGLLRDVSSGNLDLPPDGMHAGEQLAAIRVALLPALARLFRCWQEDIRPALAGAGVEILRWVDLAATERVWLADHFSERLRPELAPMMVAPAAPFPHIANLSLHLAISFVNPDGAPGLALVRLPAPRLIELPPSGEAQATAGRERRRFVLTEAVVAAHAGDLLPGVTITGCHPFRVTRDADLILADDPSIDLMEAVERSMWMRHFGQAVRLEIPGTMPGALRDQLSSGLGLDLPQTYVVEGLLDLGALWELAALDRPDLRYQAYEAANPCPACESGDLFARLRHGDLLVYHPYDSFETTMDFIRSAARDPKVRSIKQTIYRAGRNSPVMAALVDACRNGKEVTVLMELKARFEEENNMHWARALEEAGAEVAYGLPGLKVHAKVCLVTREEGKSTRRYAHLGTGNYNPGTATIYGDLGFFTARKPICSDLAELFEVLTGEDKHGKYRKLLVAPEYLRPALERRIKREIKRHQAKGDGYLAFKMNALIDRELTDLLYEASQQGVRVDLQVRGICCLRPGVPGLSENIRVTSIVGRFLEHARIYYFHNGGDSELLLGSADIRARNLDRRVETVFPVEGRRLRDMIKQAILDVHLRDTANARILEADGTYRRLIPPHGERPFDSQQHLIDHRGMWWQRP